ncbi:MAG: helix-turn-helix domain-containing protein [Armatimonadetes bacterium]|uniref:MerR family transcriptional regulator n=1 Tax=Rubritepida flocculans TaxID=182403 RepID=UPI000484A241|nr:helix-turn-helix domain-containing protein [Armatimonadota bacterium]
MQPDSEPRPFLTIAQAARLLGVSASTLRNWDRTGKLKPRRHPMNRYRVYDRAELERLKSKIEGSHASR